MASSRLPPTAPKASVRAISTKSGASRFRRRPPGATRLPRLLIRPSFPRCARSAGDALVLQVDPRHPGLHVLSHRPHGVERGAVAVVSVGDDGDPHSAGDAGCLARHLRHREEAHVRPAVQHGHRVTRPGDRLHPDPLGDLGVEGRVEAAPDHVALAIQQLAAGPARTRHGSLRSGVSRPGARSSLRLALSRSGSGGRQRRAPPSPLGPPRELPRFGPRRAAPFGGVNRGTPRAISGNRGQGRGPDQRGATGRWWPARR